MIEQILVWALLGAYVCSAAVIGRFIYHVVKLCIATKKMERLLKIHQEKSLI